MDSLIQSDIVQTALWVGCIFTIVPLGSAMCAGLLISILQAATQVQEQTIGFIVKVVVVAFVFILNGGWMMDELTQLMINILQDIPNISRGGL